MKRTTILSLLIMALAFFSQSLAADSVLHPVDLRCEYLKNPLGIDRTAPRLSWKLQAAPSAVRGLRQTAFQIQIASTEPALGAGKADFVAAEPLMLQLTRLAIGDTAGGSGGFLIKVLRGVWEQYQRIDQATLWRRRKQYGI